MHVVLMLVLLAHAAPALAQTGADPYVPVTAFDPGRDAARDIRDAVAEARRSARRVLLDVGGEWCVWCRRLDTLFVRQPQLAEFRDRGYVTVKVNYSPENKNQAALSRYPKIAGYPHLFVLGPDGRLLRSQETASLESGRGHDPETVMAFLKAWAPAGRGDVPE